MRNEIVVVKMIQYIDKILKYTSDMTFKDFLANEVVLEACVFNLSQLGELANKADTNFRSEHSEIPWNQIYGLRNRIVHDYDGVNHKLLWEIIEGDLPELRTQLDIIVSAGNE